MEAQTEGIERTRVGATVDEIHKACVEVITRGLVRLGLLQGEVEQLVKDEAYKPFFMHKTSHWLGMDVHDVGRYYIDGKARQLEAGMVLTVEPGIYIGRDYDKVPAEWRGIGVRIEDDILVTDGDPVDLTAGIPKTVAELRAGVRGVMISTPLREHVGERRRRAKASAAPTGIDAEAPGRARTIRPVRCSRASRASSGAHSPGPSGAGAPSGSRPGRSTA